VLITSESAPGCVGPNGTSAVNPPAGYSSGNTGSIKCTYTTNGVLIGSQPGCPTTPAGSGGSASGATVTCWWTGSPGNWTDASGSDPGCLFFPVDGGQ
jgi:hypothetical protein